MCGSFGLGNTAPTSQDFRRSDGIMGAGAPAGGAFQNEHRPAKDTRKSGLAPPLGFGCVQARYKASTTRLVE